MALLRLLGDDHRLWLCSRPPAQLCGRGGGGCADGPRERGPVPIALGQNRGSTASGAHAMDWQCGLGPCVLLFGIFLRFFVILFIDRLRFEHLLGLSLAGLHFGRGLAARQPQGRGAVYGLQDSGRMAAHATGRNGIVMRAGVRDRLEGRGSCGALAGGRGGAECAVPGCVTKRAHAESSRCRDLPQVPPPKIERHCHPRDTHPSQARATHAAHFGLEERSKARGRCQKVPHPSHRNSLGPSCRRRNSRAATRPCHVLPPETRISLGISSVPCPAQ